MRKCTTKELSGARIELAIFGFPPLRGSHVNMRPTLYQLSQPDNVKFSSLNFVKLLLIRFLFPG